MAYRESVDRWVPFYEPNPDARIRLFCFPHAGGGASTFRNWSRGLPTTIDVFPVQLPGRENRLDETPFARINQLTNVMADALLPYFDIPFAFFGHSMGAIIGFELARHVNHRHGLDPAYLFVSGYRAPHLPSLRQPLHRLPESAFKDKLRRLGGMPEAVLQNAELMRLVLPTLYADLALSETYTYSAREPVGYPISAFGAVQDEIVNLDEMLGWGDHTKGAFTLHAYSGNHFFFQNAEARLLQDISRYLASIVMPRGST